MNNVVSLKAVRTQKECERLFLGYKNRLVAMTKEQMAEEIGRFQQEMKKYPNHLLTLVKGRILLKLLLERGPKDPEAVRKLLSDIEVRFAKRREVENDYSRAQ